MKNRKQMLKAMRELDMIQVPVEEILKAVMDFFNVSYSIVDKLWIDYYSYLEDLGVGDGTMYYPNQEK